jgi:hypothetical protein
VRQQARTRRAICANCDNPFISKRSGAETCKDSCRQALFKKRRRAREKAESLFKARQRVEQNAHDAWMLERYQHWAARQNLMADSFGHKHIRFVGTVMGILAVQAYREDDWPWPIPWKPTFKPWLKELKHDPVNPDAGDPEVIEAVVDALQRETRGASFIQREYEKETKALLRGPVKRIGLFVRDPDWKPTPAWWQSAAPDFDDLDDVEDVRDHGPGATYRGVGGKFGQESPFDAALLDGFGVFTPRGPKG